MNYIPFRESVNRHLDRISFISEQGKKYFEQRYPEPANKSVCYLGTTNPNHIAKRIENKKEICIASCSSVIDVKRLDLIIDAIAHLKGLPVKWIHIGEGPLLAQMKQLAQEKLKGTNISWEFLGRVDNCQILETYRENDVDFFVNLSDSEGLPVSIMEAISMGIPVIARDVGGMSEIVDNHSGLLLKEEWDPDNYQTIYHYVQSRLENPGQYQFHSEACKKVWQEKFDASKNYPAFFDLFV